MFSANSSPQLASSIHVFPPPNSSFLDHENDVVYFNPHHRNNHPFVSSDCFLHAYIPPPATEKFTTNKQDPVRQHQQQLIEGSALELRDDYNNLYESGISSRKKNKTSKKDHHSKIYTAHGPRDRRVRLSVEIARKFFCLQDLLGFDKASKTLDWLFTKSKTAIHELVEGAKHSSSSTVTDQSEVVFLDTIKGGSDEEDKQKKKKSASRCVEPKRKKITRKHKSGLPVNQSRAEARARARERTKEKLHIKKLDDESKKGPGDCCCCRVSPSNLTLQSNFWSQIESQNDYHGRIEESIMEQNISMPSSRLYSYQDNLAVSNDSSSKFNSLPKFTVVHQQQGDCATI